MLKNCFYSLIVLSLASVHCIAMAPHSSNINQKGKIKRVSDTQQSSQTAAKLIDSNEETKNKTTPLHRAIKMRDIDKIRSLLDANADMDALDDNNDTPLSLVIKSLDPRLIQLFVKKIQSMQLK